LFNTRGRQAAGFSFLAPIPRASFGLSTYVEYALLEMLQTVASGLDPGSS
jgi:hypothetical protein